MVFYVQLYNGKLFQFDLVCDRELLGSLAQSFVIMGQGVGAVLSSIVSDKYVFFSVNFVLATIYYLVSAIPSKNNFCVVKVH